MFYNEGKKEKGSGIHENCGGIGGPGASAPHRVRPGGEAVSAGGTHRARKRGADPGRRRESMAQENGPFTADTAIEDVQSWIDELGL